VATAILMLGEQEIARLEDMQPDLPWRRDLGTALGSAA